jgi:hypothetical protein
VTPSELTALHVAQWSEIVGAALALIFIIWYGSVMEWRDWFAWHVMSFVLVVFVLLALSSAEFFWPWLITHESFVYASVVIVCLLPVVLAWRIFELWRVRRHN